MNHKTLIVVGAAALILLLILLFARGTTSPTSFDHINVVTGSKIKRPDSVSPTAGTPSVVATKGPNDIAVDANANAAIQSFVRTKLNLSPSDVVEFEKQSGRYYSLNAYPVMGGGGIWAIVTYDTSGTELTLTGQDYPSCDSSAIKAVPMDLLPYCYSVGDNPQLTNRNSGTVAHP